MYGCAKCYQPGITVSTSARGHTHAYPFNIADPTGPKRTVTAHASDARKAYLENSAINGIKGPTWLMKLNCYDIIEGTAIDYMHCTLLGVMKQLLSLWFGTEHKKESYYIGKQISVVDFLKLKSFDLFCYIIPCQCCLVFYHLNSGITLHYFPLPFMY